MIVAVCSTFLSLFASTLAAYAIERLRFRGSPYVGLGIYLAYLVPPSILFIPLATVIVQFGLFELRDPTWQRGGQGGGGGGAVVGCADG